MKVEKIVSLIMVSVLMIASIGCTVFADEYADDVSNKSDIEEVGAHTTDLIIDKANITDDGISWRQPYGYNAFRVWVSNTTNKAMTVKISSTWGYSKTVSVPANSSKTVVTENDAHSLVTYKVNFTTSIGTVSGKVSVRVSDQNL